MIVHPLRTFRLLALRIVVAALVISAAAAFRPAASRPETLHVVVLFNRDAVVGASSMRSGIFASTDHGDTWQHTGWNNVRAFGMAVDGDDLYLAAGNGIHRSTNNGATWKLVTDWRITEALRVAVAADHRTIVTATAHGVWRSTDRGETWQERNEGLHSTFTSALLIDTVGGMSYVGGDEGLYAWKLRDQRWYRSPDSCIGATAVLALTQHPQRRAELYAATETRGIARSADAGAHWSAASRGLPHTAYYAIAVAGDGAGTLYTAGLASGVWRSTDDGDTWNEVAHETLGGKSFHGLAVSAADPRIVYAGEYNGGVWRSTDEGATWQHVGLPGSQVWEMRVEPAR